MSSAISKNSPGQALTMGAYLIAIVFGVLNGLWGPDVFLEKNARNPANSLAG